MTDLDRLKLAAGRVTGPKESTALTVARLHLRAATKITCGCERCAAAKEIISKYAGGER